MKTALRRERLAIGVILLAGLALRLFRLGRESLWYDETVSVYLAGSPVAQLIRHTAGDIHPPGYYLLLRGWLLLTGYGDGRADPQTFGLEFLSAFLSLFFGVLLVALVYSLARKLAGRSVALVAAVFVALSPFNVWYSQEVRMYTVGAALGVVAFWALLNVAERRGEDRPAMNRRANERRPMNGTDRRPLVVYALAAAAGMYVLYYFTFLLVALNVWALAALLRRRRSLLPLLLANGGAAILYAPWIPVAFRQATQPPVPPWRTAPDLLAALLESWTALSLGQSAPAWTWPALVLTVALYVFGLIYLGRRDGNATRAGGIAVATFGPLLLILLVSYVTPLYHVRYLFTYSPVFYVGLAAGVIGLARGFLNARRAGSGREQAAPRAAASWPAALALLTWAAAAAVTLGAFWFDPAYQPDDHRAAVGELEARWRPGDAVVINAGWAYTALATYWTGDIASRTRITEPLPAPRDDAELLMVTTGHTDGDSGLGWSDPRSDFFAMPSDVAKQQTPALFERFRRVWHYRIYDTVNDPDGLLRALLPRSGQPIDERTYPGEAYLRVESYVPREGVAWEDELPGAEYRAGLQLRFAPIEVSAPPGQPVYVPLTWRPAGTVPVRIGTSVRLLGSGGETLYQPPDEQPLGPGFVSAQWPAGVAQPQTVAIAAPEGTAPGTYEVIVVAYDAGTGQPLAPAPLNGAAERAPGLLLGTLTVTPPAEPPVPRPARAGFGPVALIEAQTPVTAIAAGGQIPVELLWQSRAPAGDLIVVLQLLREDGSLAANLEESPARGRRPSSQWSAGELVRDEHTLSVPPHIEPGTYRLIVGLYDATDGRRLPASAGLFGRSDHHEIRAVDVR
jgi:uncharacterized membrane protein